MKLWQSAIFILLPGLYAFFFTQNVLLKGLTRLGMSEENAFNTVRLSVFLLFLLATMTALSAEGWSYRWSSLKRTSPAQEDGGD